MSLARGSFNIFKCSRFIDYINWYMGSRCNIALGFRTRASAWTYRAVATATVPDGKRRHRQLLTNVWIVFTKKRSIRSCQLASEPKVQQVLVNTIKGSSQDGRRGRLYPRSGSEKHSWCGNSRTLETTKRRKHEVCKVDEIFLARFAYLLDSRYYINF